MLTSVLITGFYTGILAILHIALSMNVINLRMKLKIGIGDGGNHDLARAIRCHGNFIEHVPLSILLLGIYELNGGSVFMVHACGGLLVAARALHTIGLSKTIKTSWQRFSGTLTTFILMLVLGLFNIFALV